MEFCLYSIRYGCELNKLKKSLLETRLLVYICKAMNKYNKSIQLLQPVVATTAKSTQIQSTTETTAETIDTIQTILVNKKCHSLCKELIKNYLVLLDNWPQPICSEFYNQVNKLIRNFLF